MSSTTVVLSPITDVCLRKTCTHRGSVEGEEDASIATRLSRESDPIAREPTASTQRDFMSWMRQLQEGRADQKQDAKSDSLSSCSSHRSSGSSRHVSFSDAEPIIHSYDVALPDVEESDSDEASSVAPLLSREEWIERQRALRRPRRRPRPPSVTLTDTSWTLKLQVASLLLGVLFLSFLLSWPTQNESQRYS